MESQRCLPNVSERRRLAGIQIKNGLIGLREVRDMGTPEVEFDGAMSIDHVAFAGGRISESMGTLGDRLGRAFEKAGEGGRIFDRIGPVALVPIAYRNLAVRMKICPSEIAGELSV